MTITRESKVIRSPGVKSFRFGLGFFFLMLVVLICRPCLASAEKLPPGWIDAKSSYINAKGAVIGYGYEGYTRKGFLYSEGTYSELLPPGWADAMPNAIKDNGDVIGYGDEGYIRKGLLYRGGTYSEVLPAGWTIVPPYRIGARRYTVASGYDAGICRGLSYSPPQPTREYVSPISLENIPSISTVDRNLGLIFFFQNRHKKH
jgi:hypothetical protein